MVKLSNANQFVDIKSLDRIAIELKGFESEMPGAVTSALNRTLDHINTRVGKIVTQNYAIKQKIVKGTIKKYKARPGRLGASLISRGHTLSMANFPHSPSSPGSKNKGSVKVKIKKNKGKEAIKTNPKPFLTTTGAKSADKTQYNVFRRTSESRFPITVIRTLAVPQMIGSDAVEGIIQKDAIKKLDERITHEINYRLTKIQKKVNK